MADYAFSLVNVFGQTAFGGNPLCVFEDARGLTDENMQALAVQFNLSETAFILPPTGDATARVRIFTPMTELPFAGHPALGTAHVLRDLLACGDTIKLEMRAGLVALEARQDDWVFTAPMPQGGPRTARPLAGKADIAAMLGLSVDDLLDEPLWVNTGSEQLLVPVKTPDIVRRVQPDPSQMARWPVSAAGRRNAYVFAPVESAGPTRFGQRALARYFMAKPGSGVDEDPGTGSACANLGGWLIATGRELPTHVKVEQGASIGRPCLLQLEVKRDQTIRVGGRVMTLGRGTISLQP
ncbi:Phenazine biosynthesis protein PhzF [plant metagenome]|uniref:Phenazine biosynthesis protein PhzF n=1 Tax=plant metagenome TaxID=1297885 RepID=A0A484T130_9ZZZZ